MTCKTVETAQLFPGKNYPIYSVLRARFELSVDLVSLLSTDVQSSVPVFVLYIAEDRRQTVMESCCHCFAQTSITRA
jgi:hypothetical protein